jgi:serine/threonine protein phosphatase PrpC/LysM repeat protein
MTEHGNPLNFQFGNHTDVGRVRQANEDYLGYFNTLNGHVFVVCDGMGGHVGGATAAQMAVNSIRAFFEHRFYDYPREAMRQALLYANGQVHAAAGQNPQLRGMGTTCVLALFRQGELWYGHVGDSRIYRFTGGRLERLTRDHSYVQQLMDQGLLTEAEAENHPRRNELTRALGTSREVVVDVSSQPLVPAPGDTLLLCTDGLTGLLSDEIIRAELARGGPVQHRAVGLVERANDAGGYDNITVQLIGFEAQPAARPVPPVAPPVPAAQTPPVVPPRREPPPASEPQPLKTSQPRPETRPAPAPVATRAPEPSNSPEMAKRTPARKKGPDLALIALGALALIVLVMFISGAKYLSDEPVENSELMSGTIDTTAVAEEQEVAQAVTASNPESAGEKPTPPKPDATPPAKKPASATAAKPAETAPGKSAATTATATTGKGTTISHTVRAGETFSSIARRYNLTNQTLKKLNPAIKNEGTDLKSDVTRLQVRVQTVHTVGPGDILSKVAGKYNVSKELIMAANGKTADRTTRGESLIIPYAQKQ